MPELPEVETFVRQLRKPLIGRKIKGVVVNWGNMIVGSKPETFCRKLKDCKITVVSRRAKYLVFSLVNSNHKRSFLLIHLRMSGVLEVHPSDSQLLKHDRIIFSLDNGKDLRMNDTRKFGKLELVHSLDARFKDIGPEPLSDDFTFELFEKRIERFSGKLKPLLLNQRFIAGLGNIYVDEALWLSSLHPKRKVDSIDNFECRALYKSIRVILKGAINSAGTDFGDGVVPGGRYQPKVYGRDGAECKRCGNIIERLVVSQRGTHICPYCQPMRREKVL